MTSIGLNHLIIIIIILLSYLIIIYQYLFIRFIQLIMIILTGIVGTSIYPITHGITALRVEI